MASHLVDDDHRVRRQVRVAGDLPQEEPLREKQNARASSPGRVEAHLEWKKWRRWPRQRLWEVYVSIKECSRQWRMKIGQLKLRPGDRSPKNRRGSINAASEAHRGRFRSCGTGHDCSSQQVSQNSAAINDSFRRSITEYRSVDGYSYKEFSMISGYCPIYRIDPWSAGDYGL